MNSVGLESPLSLENMLDLMNELSNIALKCATCRKLFKEVIELYKGNTGPRKENRL
jgi:hypothetical protein